MAKKVEQIVEVWKGNCPFCGNEQEDSRERNVDVLCSRCVAPDAIVNMSKQLVGATIIKVELDYEIYDLLLASNEQKF